VHESTVGKWLRQFGLTRLQARPCQPKTNLAAQEAFQKTSSDRQPACGGRNWLRYPGLEGSGRKVFGGCDPLKNASLMKNALLGTTTGTPIEVWFQDEARVGQKGSLTYVWWRKRRLAS
jgi:hypothetical protein